MTVAATYRSERSGLVFAYLFRSCQVGVALEPDEVATYHDGDGFRWLHFDLSNAAAERWMRERLRLPDVFFDAIADGSRSTRVEDARDALVAVVNDVLYDFAFQGSDFATLWVCVTPRLVVSARRKPLRTIERLRAAVRRGETFGSSTELLVHLMRDQADVLVQIFRDATTRVDRIEDAILSPGFDDRRAEIGALRRVLVRMQRLLAPEPAALFRLLNRPPGWIAAADLHALRQSTEEFSGGLSDSAALLERIKLLQEELAAQVNEENNRNLILLNILTVLGLPFTIVGGLFGMNVGGIPFAEDRHGFWTVVVIVTAFAAAALWLLSRRRR